MLDLGYVREHLEVIEKMARDRGVAVDLGAFRAIDGERRKIIHATETKKAERNKASEEIARLKKSTSGAKSEPYSTAGGHAHSVSGSGGQPASTAGGEPGGRAALERILAQMKALSEELKRNDERIAELDEQLKQFMLTVPNIPHASVPVGHGAADNVEVRRWGAPPKFDFAPRPHWEIGESAGILNFEAASRLQARASPLYAGWARGWSARSRISFSIRTRANGYTEVLPPFLVNTASLTGVGQLPKFAADMFHLEGHGLVAHADVRSRDDEHVTAMRRSTRRASHQVCAWTACFRSEAGAAGKDTRGIKRQHQFQKVELFKFARPDQSYDELESLVATPKRCSRNSACTIASCNFAPATWDSPRRRRTTSRCGCRRRANSWKFRRARIAKRFKRGGRAFDSSRRAAAGNRSSVLTRCFRISGGTPGTAGCHIRSRSRIAM